MDNIFSIRLKSLRKLNNFTQKELAKQLGIVQTTIANYENGKRIPDLNKITEMANLFNVSIDYLLGRNEELQENHKNIDYDSYMKFLLDGNKEKASNILLSLLESNIDLIHIYQDYIGKSLNEIGVMWEKGEMNIWTEHLISEMSIDMMRILASKNKPMEKNGKKILAFTPGVEMHNIGLRMACQILESKGYEILYLGTNIPAISVLDAIHKNRPDALALSITIESNFESAYNLIAAIRRIYQKGKLSILLGGLSAESFKNIYKNSGVDYFFSNLEELMKVIDK